jgi:hypothetical protein
MPTSTVPFSPRCSTILRISLVGVLPSFISKTFPQQGSGEFVSVEDPCNGLKIAES